MALKTNGLYYLFDEKEGWSVIRFLVEGLAITTASMPEEKLHRILGFLKPNARKDVFIIPAPVTLDGKNIRWVQQVSMHHQVTYAGIYAGDHLVVDTSSSNGHRAEGLRYEFISEEEIESTKKAKKPARKRAPAKKAKTNNG